MNEILLDFGGRYRRWYGFGFVLLVAMFPTYAALGLLLSFPAVVAALADDSPRRELPVVIMPFLFAAMVHPFHQLWLSGSSWRACADVMADPLVFVVDWVAAASGWFLSEIAMIFARSVYLYGASKQRRDMERIKEALEAEWGAAELLSQDADKKNAPRKAPKKGASDAGRLSG